MDPLSSGLGAARTATNFFGGVVDRWRSAAQAKMDVEAMLRLLVLEIRRNLTLLDVAVGQKRPLETPLLWRVPPLLQTEIVEAVLGRGTAEAGAFRLLSKVALADDSEVATKGAGALAKIYVRITALQTLAVLGERSPLRSVKIQQRLVNLRAALREVLKALSHSPVASKAAV